MIRLFLLLSILCLCEIVSAGAETTAQLCTYLDANNKRQIVANPRLVPTRYKKSVVCQMLPSSSALVDPDQITLKGNIRSEDISSPLGRISLRWPRKAESLFGRTPLKATIDAASTVKRVISNSAFSGPLRNFKRDWKIVFIDEANAETIIPASITGCHPGWMTPPANIYVVAQRVVAGCSGQQGVNTSVADEQLARLLIHEMAHGVEYALLGDSHNPDTSCAEGFATWFTEISAKQNSLVDAKVISAEHSMLAKQSVRTNPTGAYFDGSASAYARAAMNFRVLTQKYGIAGLVDLYALMREQKMTWEGALQKRFNLTTERLLREADKSTVKN